MLFLLNLFFYFLFLVYSAVLIPICTLLVVIVKVFTRKRFTEKFLRKMVRLYGMGIIWILPRLFIKVNYFDNGDDSSGPFLFIINHRSGSDAFLMACLPEEIVQIVSGWPMRLPVLGPVAGLAGYVCIKDISFNDFYLRCSNLLNDGVSIVSFPEGTRSASKKMGPFTSGIFKVALQSKTPIVPICIMGNENKPTRGSWIMQPGKVEVHRLKALHFDEYKNMTAFQLKNHVRLLMSNYMAENE